MKQRYNSERPLSSGWTLANAKNANEWKIIILIWKVKNVCVKPCCICNVKDFKNEVALKKLAH